MPARERDAGRTKRQALPEAQRLNMFAADPHGVVVIGVDTEHKSRAEHPLFDERVFLPIDEAMVESLLLLGPIKPVNVRKTENGAEVVAGRRLTLHCREANARLKKMSRADLDKYGRADKDPIQLRVVVEKLDDVSAMRMMLAENEIRLEDDPIIRAAKIADMVKAEIAESENAGEPISQAEAVARTAKTCGCTEQTIRNRLALDGASARIKKAVRDQVVSETAGAKLGRLPEAEQQRALDEMISGDAPKTTVQDAERAARNARGGAENDELEFEPPPKSVLKKLAKDPKKVDDPDLKEALANLDPTVRATLRFVLGLGGANKLGGLKAACRAVGHTPWDDPE